ncbi:N-acetylmuramic acid 6-phosphate etherase [Sporosarcina sp. ANT_H38]|uniref:N-acetylmuramic acid 6-phosphate etherase n=1 Tax=Sporosarcina sp. ANT_H38 TaxID=2597358 RepID=UPI0011F269D6|nr:N-acetylmuramic acid 6-phosphate etherase [Sporosarcina sp. ANT_H38]KAA0955380.1 N-acetylmuramic acid 6-phosphate etherase [Sporosarcina sp. ANT_H38]
MLGKLSTEKRNSKTMQLDEMSLRGILEAMNQEDSTVPSAIANELDHIEKVVESVIQSFKIGGRLIYVGAGTSGRLGILDAVECVPTFGVSPEMVLGFIAGGMEAFTAAVEGAEDSVNLGALDMESASVCVKDTVIGIAASGRTPYVIGALDYAREIGAKTVAISCNKDAEISKHAEMVIEVETGPEILTGSTRLKAGTAQKLVLNMISTASMIGIGKVYENLMVDVQSTNEKLTERSKRIIMEATQVDYETAENYYEKAQKHVKTAIVMILLQSTYEEAVEKLALTGGFVRKSI